MLPHVALQLQHNPILSSDNAAPAVPFSSGTMFPFTSRDAFYHDDLPLALTLGRATISLHYCTNPWVVSSSKRVAYNLLLLPSSVWSFMVDVPAPSLVLSTALVLPAVSIFHHLLRALPRPPSMSPLHTIP